MSRDLSLSARIPHSAPLNVNPGRRLAQPIGTWPVLGGCGIHAIRQRGMWKT
ncbi:hypothetical protein ACFOGG_18530 [Brenneria rubrifaciens]|uniref:hypothetical protein n=1 Tax=Brenneria rubrifaciens TaxID=55213 RepID=UPI003621E21C